MSWDQLEYMLSKFNFSFNWKYNGERELRSLLGDVFRILEGQDERQATTLLLLLLINMVLCMCLSARGNVWVVSLKFKNKATQILPRLPILFLESCILFEKSMFGTTVCHSF